MVFIDNLAFSLFSLSFAGLLVLYTITSMYLIYRKKQRNFSESLQGASIPLAIIGVYMIIQGLWGQFTWPLPGPYNILFYDPLIAFGMVLLSFAICIRYKTHLEYVGFFGLLAGVMAILYGINGYNLGLTKAPIALLGMYFLYGAAGILAYPVTLIADRLPGLQKKRAWKGWHVALVLFWFIMLFASLIAGYVAFAAVPAHLLSPP